jgi:Cof subfamily protein (haloacid dehalogenase superfamily)
LLKLDVIDYGIDVARGMDVHLQLFLPQGTTVRGVEKNSWEPLFVDQYRAEAEMYRQHTGIQPVVMDLKTAITAPELKGCPKLMFIADPALHDEIRQKMIERFGSRIYMARTFPTFLEVMNAGVSKGTGLKTVMECRGLKPEEVIAFGDEENDIPMFSVAGFSAAPSNAREKVRQAADFVYGSNAEEGIAAFLEKMF